MPKALDEPARRIAAFLAGALLLVCGVGAADAQAVDHSGFTRLLSQHVDAAGMVDYDAFRADSGFARYLSLLEATDPTLLPERERLALWINAYNAYTIELIVRHEERRSIRNINRTFGVIPGKGPWAERSARVGGRALTLDEIEHEIIRREFAEPRIHFALVCAAVGCPPLRREAFTGSRLEEQLEDQARSFLLRSPAKNRVDAAAGRVWLSPIFRWYGEDFGEDRRALGRYLARYYGGAEAELLRGGEFRLDYTRYDWSLNGQRRGG
jgi:hypothetical protein